MQRRHFLAASALPLIGCKSAHEIEGSFEGINVERGHRLRDTKTWAAPTVTRRTRVLIAGGGVAGLAAARALRLRGMHDFALLELEDSAGGNARSTQLNGLPCPMGAHYLPVPGDDVPQVQDLLEELGLRRRVSGRWTWDERHLCHSPQERLFFRGAWQEGLLPLHGVGPQTLAAYRKFSALVEQLSKAARWVIPVTSMRASALQLELDGVTFSSWLGQQNLADPQLLWYLDYCCRDDFGAGLNTVSAWAGIHYFASRHGFHVPGDSARESDGVFTWPEGNAWLTQRLAQPLTAAGQLHTGQIVLRIAQGKHGVEVDAFNSAMQTVERWQAERCIVALPVQVAARVLQDSIALVRERAAQIRYAPWLVANVHIAQALNDRPGAAPSWDNVIYPTPNTQGVASGLQSLGYVDATHQSLQRVPGATVLTWYLALGDVPDARRLLLEQPWTHWRDALLADLALVHPDLRDKATRIAITRYGHAMAMPTPGTLRQVKAAQTLAEGRLQFAHSDWAGYSIFEEAFSLGHAAGSAVG
jgi:monoamine oxidase